MSESIKELAFSVEDIAKAGHFNNTLHKDSISILYFAAKELREIDALKADIDRALKTIAEYDTENEALKARITELEQQLTDAKDALQFVERWAVHHGTKPHTTPAEALSVIQHYPPIADITKGYRDGKTPDTFNPFERIKELEQLTTWQPIETAPNDGTLVIVGWADENGEYHDFDYQVDGLWENYFSRTEHVLIGGGNVGKPEDAPYTHWMPLPKPPAAIGEKA